MEARPDLVGEEHLVGDDGIERAGPSAAVAAVVTAIDRPRAGRCGAGRGLAKGGIERVTERAGAEARGYATVDGFSAGGGAGGALLRTWTWACVSRRQGRAELKGVVQD